MKTLLFIIITCAVAFLVYKSGFLLESSYKSESGISLSFPTKLIVTADSQDLISLSYPKPSTSQIQIRKIPLSNPALSLLFSISLNFSRTAFDEKEVEWGRRGIVFLWESPTSVEHAFAFKDGDSLYIVTTVGGSGETVILEDLEKVASSLKLR